MSLERALEYARGNPVEGLPRMAALIVSRRGHFISLGFNSRKSDPLAAKYGRHPDAIYPHAEIAAIKNALKLIDEEALESCTMYIARVKKDGSPALAKPCSGCQRALLQFGLENVEWTTDLEPY
jgi:tRNA(Arg) A34 adenosine deaminase TadA